MNIVHSVRNKARWFHAFLGTSVMPDPDRTLATLIYRKFTHTDKYLNQDSHHIVAKYIVVNTLTHRGRTVCSNPQLPEKQ